MSKQTYDIFNDLIEPLRIQLSTTETKKLNCARPYVCLCVNVHVCVDRDRESRKRKSRSTVYVRCGRVFHCYMLAIK